ncbi:MAG: carbamate kinase [Candidatus Sedimenticola sp. 20ELBAFRAG]
MMVIALGGNALVRRGEAAEMKLQRHNVDLAVNAIAGFASGPLVITHGNGPQVGLLALQAESCSSVAPYPLDVLNAETEGMLGYLIEQALRNRLPERKVVSLLTQVRVAADDPAFKQPSKPIGPLYDIAQASRLNELYNWRVMRDGEGYRRVVPSPEPLTILELPAIKVLLDAGAVVICAGGGGIPVVEKSDDTLIGVEAVIDKDLASALLAHELKAKQLLLLTDVDAVYQGWGSAAAKPIDEATVTELREQSFAPGSMGPKVEAACRFVEQTGGRAFIGRLEDAAAIVEGSVGTRVLPG